MCLILLTQEYHPEFLIRTYLRYEILDAALEYAVAMIRRVRDARSLCRMQSMPDFPNPCRRTMHAFRNSNRDLRPQLGYPTLSSTKFSWQRSPWKTYHHGVKNCAKSCGQ